MRSIKIRSVLLSIIVLFSFGGCRVNKPESSDAAAGSSSAVDPFDSGEAEAVEYRFGFGIKKPDESALLEYTGEPLQVSYYIENSDGPALDMGLILTVNGICQPYRLKSDEPEKYVHSVHVPAGGETVVPIEFTPICGKAGETLTIRYLYMLNPDTKPDRTPFNFGNNQTITQIYPRSIRVKKDTPALQDVPAMEAEPQAMSKEQVREYMTDSHGNERIKMERMTIAIDPLQNNPSNAIKVQQNKLQFDLLGYGGMSGDYAVTLFINQIALDKPIGMTIKEGQFLTRKSCVIDLSAWDADKHFLSAYNTLYAIAVPLADSEDYFAEKSQSFVFEN